MRAPCSDAFYFGVGSFERYEKLDINVVDACLGCMIDLLVLGWLSG